jgi:hypothetical protein
MKPSHKQTLSLVFKSVKSNLQKVFLATALDDEPRAYQL